MPLLFADGMLAEELPQTWSKPQTTDKWNSCGGTKTWGQDVVQVTKVSKKTRVGFSRHLGQRIGTDWQAEKARPWFLWEDVFGVGAECSHQSGEMLGIQKEDAVLRRICRPESLRRHPAATHTTTAITA